MRHEDRTRKIPGLPPEETETRLQTGQSDDISEAITVSEKHLDNQTDPVSTEEVHKTETVSPPSDAT